VQPVRIGIIGLGNMGRMHARDCMESEAVDLVAVCDIVQERLDEYPEVARRFLSADELLKDGEVEAVLIATPHYDHTPIAISAFQHSIHVLCEKPVGVHVNDVRKMIAAYEQARSETPGLRFGAMFQQRSLPHWRVIKRVLEGHELGQLIRASWIVTDWFRTQYYYDTGSWRATWKGEGGGVLLNQCPHNLDLYQWFFGMPTIIDGHLSIGKHHDIEVEDEVTAFLRHENGMVGHFVTSTAESPGTNRLEVVGEQGKLVYEGDLVIYRNRQSVFEAIQHERRAFMQVEYATETLPLEPGGGTHREVIERFASSIRGAGQLVAEGLEGLRSVELANGILMSHFGGVPVSLPIDGDRYAELLARLIQESARSGHGHSTKGQS
jgi:predicted dehydrogenase